MQGFLRSTPSSTFTLDFYSNDGCTARPAGFPRGTRPSSVRWRSRRTGPAPWPSTSRFRSPIEPEDFVSATATDSDGNTSEFSQRLPFSHLPRVGDAAGGASVTIQGTDFADGATVAIGGSRGLATSSSQNGTTHHATLRRSPRGSVNDLTVTNLDDTTGTLPKGLGRPIFSTFPTLTVLFVRDDPRTERASRPASAAVSTGRRQSTLRQQMAVFLLKARYGVCYVPPPCAGVFHRRAVPLDLRRLDRGSLGPGHHGRLRRRRSTARRTRCGATRWPSSC